MAKYTFEFKKKIVMEYIAGKGGCKYLSKKFGIRNRSLIQAWIAAYKNFGDKGIMRSRKKRRIFFPKKIICCKIISIK